MRSLPLTLALLLVALMVHAPPAPAAWSWPLAGELITPYRNGDDPYAPGQHRGIDIAGPVGAPVAAAAGGEVLFAGTAGSSGVTVSVRTAEGLDTSYLHLSSLAVRKGERVPAGARLGSVGTSGRRSVERAHLHFGVRESGSRHAYRDPLALLGPPPAAAPNDPLPAPAPVPVPAPVAPAPAPLPAPAPGGVPARRPLTGTRRVPVPRPSPGARRGPAARRVPVARGVPVYGGVEAPAPGAQPEPAPGGSEGAERLRGAGRLFGAAAGSAPAGHAERGADVHSARAPGARPELGPGARTAGGSPPAGDASSGSPVSATQRSGASPASPGGSAGPDLGWVAACLGLLLAAAILGLSGEGRSTARRGAARVSSWLRPLVGRG